MVMITAQEAFKLSIPTEEKYLKFIEREIINAAINQQKKVIITTEPYAFWLSKGDEPDDLIVRNVLNTLKSNGFTVDLYDSDSSASDDYIRILGLRISWENANSI